MKQHPLRHALANLARKSTTFARNSATWIALGGSLAIATNAHTASIADIYAAALENDPVVGAAAATYLARREIVPQSRASLLPTVSVQGTSSKQKQGIPGTAIDTNPASPTFGLPFADVESNSHNWSAQLSQSLFNLPSWYSWASARKIRDQAEWDLASAQQNLITRVAEAYLNVLRAAARLESAVAEEEAVQRQLEQVQQRFDVGLVAITDVLESQAAYDSAVVRRIQAEGDHDIFFESLRTITNTAYDTIDQLSSSLPIVDPAPADEEEWVRTALAQNFQIRSASAGLESAERDLKSRLAGHLPTLDASASHNHSVTGGRSFFGNKFDTTTYSVTLRVPVFQGGLTHSRFKEARARVEEARQRLIERELTVSRDTRNLFRSVQTDVVRVAARLKAIRSSTSALEATETGYEVGTRNIVEVLQAQQRLFASQFDYADSRYNYVLNLMRLKQAAGSLEQRDIGDLNEYMDTVNPIEKVSP